MIFVMEAVFLQLTLKKLELKEMLLQIIFIDEMGTI